MNKKITFLMVPTLSAILFATIMTAAPTTVMGDLNAKSIQGIETPAQENNSPAATTGANSVSTNTVNAQNTVPTSNSTQTTTSNTKSANTSSPAASKPFQTPKPAVSTTTSSSRQAKAAAIIATGKQYIGVKYLYGGTTPAGFDCSGFVQYTFAKNGISLPRVSRDQYKVGTSVSFSNLQPGDLVFFSLAKNGVIDHDGIYVGNGQFINSSSSKGVTIYSLGSYWQSAFVGAKRVF